MCIGIEDEFCSTLWACSKQDPGASRQTSWLTLCFQPNPLPWDTHLVRVPLRAVVASVIAAFLPPAVDPCIACLQARRDTICEKKQTSKVR